MKPILLSDSSADICGEFYAENDVARVNLSYTINGEQFFDTSTAEETSHLYARMRKGDVSTTSQVNVQTFYDIFESFIPQGRPIVALYMSGKLSGTFAASQTAKEMILQKYPDAEIYNIDSYSATVGEGQMLSYAVTMRDQGMSGRELAAWLEENKTRFLHHVFVDDLVYLRRGGRLTAAESFFGNLLGIKPLIWVDPNGYLVPREKKRGRKQAIAG
ncbi:MAG: DegV family protein, partial [Clostridiales bacterium]|nr:DegV family protein [Clostridiales bacterium]